MAPGGKKHKRAKKGDDPVSQFLPLAEKDQMYGIAVKMLGNRRLTVHCADGKERLATIPGKFKGKKFWVSEGMVLLLNVREYQQEKADVIYVYSSQDAKYLKRKGELMTLIQEKNEEESVQFEERSNLNESQEIGIEDL